MKLTQEEALKLIDDMAAHGELEFVDFKNKDGKSNRAADLFGKIYMVAHSSSGDCKHPNWEEWAFKAYQEIKDH